MYYLEQKQFKPEMVLFGILFIPCIFGLVIANIMLFKIQLLVILLIVLAIYLTLVFVLWKLSKRKNYYFSIMDDRVEIVFHDFTIGKTKLELQFNQIVKMEYYRMSSVKGWLMLYSYIFPKCVYITYNIEGKLQTKFIGYMDIKDVKEIANTINAEIRVY